jgi:DNA-directed RNA polymerase subunit RPC12/RpoP
MSSSMPIDEPIGNPVDSNRTRSYSIPVQTQSHFSPITSMPFHMNDSHPQSDTAPVQTNVESSTSNTVPVQTTNIASPRSNTIPPTNQVPPTSIFDRPSVFNPVPIQFLSNPFILTSNINKQDTDIDHEILQQKDIILNQQKKIQFFRLELQNQVNILNEMTTTLNSLEDKKRYVVKKRRVIDQNNRHETRDKYNEDLDEIRNERREGTCQYINHRNARCWRLADDKHVDGKIYCFKCLSKVLLEQRNIKREYWKK